MASRALPSHLRPSAAAGKAEDGAAPRHHGKSQSHVVSTIIVFNELLFSKETGMAIEGNYHGIKAGFRVRLRVALQGYLPEGELQHELRTCPCPFPSSPVFPLPIPLEVWKMEGTTTTRRFLRPASGHPSLFRSDDVTQRSFTSTSAQYLNLDCPGTNSLSSSPHCLVPIPPPQSIHNVSQSINQREWR
jgi:hypothetical protein